MRWFYGKEYRQILNDDLPGTYIYRDFHFIPKQGKQKQTARTVTYTNFTKAEASILLCTDVVARGMDIPAVDWIVQYDPPDDPQVGKQTIGF